MTDLERILPLWRELENAKADYLLATVVEVQGSSYRKPGAFMLLAPDGRRAGAVSGGCLESQVASRAWWLTNNGPTIQQYSTTEEDGELPYGSGCGGVVTLLLERRATAGVLLRALEQAFEQRVPLAVATVLEGPRRARRAFAGLEQCTENSNDDSPSAGKRNRAANAFLDANSGPLHSDEIFLRDFAEIALASRRSTEKTMSTKGTELRVWVDYRPARTGLAIFGAGDDAQPLLHLARELGWFVTVCDGRSQLATRDRFPSANALHVLPVRDLPANGPGASSALAHLRPRDAAVVMTHSFEQDARILASLLTLDMRLAYIGVLGPQRRTRELLAEAARMLNLPGNEIQMGRWLSKLHAPMGLDLGAEAPETIALSVLAEIQQSLTAATALPLRQVRAAALTSTS